MIRLTLRQCRTEAIAGFGVLTMLAIILAITGPHLAQVHDAFQRACKAAETCSTAPEQAGRERRLAAPTAGAQG